MRQERTVVCAEPARRFIRSYDDLDVFQRSMALLKPIHAAVLRFPDYEKFDLASQLRRACKSIPANIAEGYGRRRSAKEFQSFLSNALGSATEVEVHLKIARELDYLSESEFNGLLGAYQIIGKQLYRLMQHWRTIDSSPPSSHLQEPNHEV
jgi:four helix bundle protein